MLLIFFISFFGIVGTFIISAIAIADLGIAFTNMEALMDFDNPANLQWLKIIQVVSALSMFLIPALLTGYLVSIKSSNYLHLRTKIKAGQVLLILILITACIPLINFLGELNSKLILPEFASRLEIWMRTREEAAQQAGEAFLIMDSVGSLVFNLFMFGVVAALTEEVLFRGIFQNILVQLTKNYHVGIWLTAIIFSAIHMQFYGFIPRMLLGAMFGYMLVWSGTLWVPIVAHFIHNSIVVVGLYMVTKNEIPIDPEAFGVEPEHIVFLIPALIISAGTLYIFYKNRTENFIYATNKNGPVNTDPNC